MSALHRLLALGALAIGVNTIGAHSVGAQLPAQAPAPRVRRTATDIRLDGRLDEPDWMLADSISDFHQKEPVEGATPTERTVVRMLATPTGLAVGWWLSDHDIAHLVRTQLRRDAALRSDDYVSMMIDGLSDRRSAFYFRVNSNGSLWDGEHINTEVGNEEWDGIWDARATAQADGWTAEMLIPWTTLRYKGDVTSMRMNFRRFLPRTNEEILWKAWRQSQGYRFLDEAGTIEGFADLPPRARAELRPYVLTEGRLAERTFDVNGDDAISIPSEARAALGLDVKVPVTSTLTADLTTFPDFAQAEVDRQVVNLTRFPLFFPEQRPFFTEGSSIFLFGREQQAQMFYSRRIGLGADGAAVDIPFGARMQGRAGHYQLGLLAVRTAGDEDATSIVARARRDVLGRGFVGAMTTFSDREVRPGALSGGLDFEFPFYVLDQQNLTFFGNAAWSRDSTGGASGGHYRFVADYPNDRADIVFRYDRVEAGYNPALGFVVQNGITRLGGSTAITPRPKKPGPIRRYEFNLLSYDVVTELGGRLDNASFTVRPFGATFRQGDVVQLNLQRRFDGPTAPFDLAPGVTVAPGDYWWNRVEAVYTSANVRPWIIEASASTGDFYDGTRVDLNLAGTIRRQPHVEMRLEYARNDVALPVGSFVAHTIRFRGDYAFSPRLTATLFAQADDRSDRGAVNARLRWTTSPGSDLYVVWNSAWPTALDRGIPWDRPLQGGLVAKYVRFFRR